MYFNKHVCDSRCIVSEAFHPAAKSTSSACFDAEIIEQLKQKLDSTERQLGATEQRLQLAESKIRVLEERLRLQRIAKYGPSSEKLSSAQLELLELEPGVSSDEIQAENEREAVSPPSEDQQEKTSDKQGRKHPGRQSLPGHLPRVEKIVACPPEQGVCGGCGAETTVIGYEASEQLDVEPAKYFVLVTRRKKRAASSAKSVAWLRRRCRSGSSKSLWSPTRW